MAEVLNAGAGVATARLSDALGNASAKAEADDRTLAAVKRANRPKPAELQAELSAEARNEIATERYLLDGFFKAKLQNGEQEVEITDVLVIRNLQAIAKSLVDRSSSR